MISKEAKPAMENESRDDRIAPTPSWRERLKYWTGLNRAIALFVAARLWSACAGVVTILLIAHFLTANEQGYYYTFFSLVALQVVFELGFGFVILQMAAHERAELSFLPGGQIDGNPAARSRLASLLKLFMTWYAVADALMISTLLPAGLYFFNLHQHIGTLVAWRGPWSLLVLAVAANFLLCPMAAFIEGCGFVPQVALMHLGQVLLGSLLAWTAMATRHGLYSPAMQMLGLAIVQGLFLLRPRFRRMLASLLHCPCEGHTIDWRLEILPFQWRIAITWLSSYFTYQAMTPILFSYQGPQTAGRLGMSMSITTALSTIGLAWMSTKASPFGNLIARGEIEELNRVFFRTLWQSTALVSMGAVTVFAALEIVSQRLPQLAMRVLPPGSFAFLLLTMLMNHVLSSEALYMRAHKREPLLVQTVTVAVVLLLSTLILGRTSGASAVVGGYFLFGGLLSLGWGTSVFISKRREWYGLSVFEASPVARAAEKV